MNTVSVDSFTLVTQIGEGTYSKVFLVRYKNDGQLYALKIIEKQFIIQRKKEKNIMTQKLILSQLYHPNLVQVHSSFQDPKSLYFVLEYCPGGELFHLLALLDKFNEDQTKFYVAQIILALEELHSINVIYRDLKPENIIIDCDGYLKLTDFGLSKILNKKNQLTFSFCGTPEYLAPEIIKKIGHGFEVDWWSLGCLTYEMITGHPPFSNQNRTELYSQILKKQLNLSKFHSSLQDFLKRLLHKDYKKRLGHRGIDEIKNHPWLIEINWNALQIKKIKAPFIPKLSSQTDTINFQKRFIKSNEEIAYQKVEEETADDEKFEGFSFNFEQQ